jgi:hypothetical protein
MWAVFERTAGLARVLTLVAGHVAAGAECTCHQHAIAGAVWVTAVARRYRNHSLYLSTLNCAWAGFLVL